MVKKITDKKILDTIKQIDNEDEQAMNNVFKTILYTLLDIKNGLNKEVKVYKQPTKNKKDIIVGR